MSDPTIVLDSGVIEQVNANPEFRWLLRDLIENGWVPVIPTVVLAEAITGRAHDAPVNQAVKRLGTVGTTEPTARRAGRLRFAVQRSGARRVPSGIAAIVAAHASDCERSVVFTTDPTELRRLLADSPRIIIDRP